MSDHQPSGAVLDRPRGGELRRVPLSKIVVREGHNPREAVDRDGDDFKSLVASVRAHGVLTPLRLTELHDDTFELVAGERRYWAALEASCIDVPAYVRVPASDDDDEKVKIASEALAENDHRVGLNPIERARVYHRLRERMTVKGIAQDVGRTQKHVKDTLALLDLPESLQAMVADGSLPLNVVPKLLELGRVHREFPELVVSEVVDDHETTWMDLREDPVGVLSNCAKLPDDVYRVQEWYRVDEFELTEKAKRDVAAIERISRGPAGSITFTASDVETADALGAVCRSEVTDWATLIVGADVAAQLVCDKLAARAKELRRSERERKRQETASQAEAAKASDAPSGNDQDGSPDAGPSTTPPDPEAEERRREEQARQERQRAEAERTAAVAYNERLGALLANALASVKLDARALKILGATPIAHQLREVAARGARYGFPNWVTIETAAGKEKRRYLDPKEAEAKAIEYLASAKKPGEVVGRQLALVLMAVFADERCIARSHRVGWKPTIYDGPWTAEAGDLIDELAAEHLPADLVKDQLAERAAAREAARAREAAKQTVHDLLQQIGELDAAGVDQLEAAIGVAWPIGWTWESDRAERAVSERRKELEQMKGQPDAGSSGPESEGAAESDASESPDGAHTVDAPEEARDSSALPAAA